jgi:hypothetical protein
MKNIKIIIIASFLLQTSLIFGQRGRYLETPMIDSIVINDIHDSNSIIDSLIDLNKLDNLGYKIVAQDERTITLMLENEPENKPMIILLYPLVKIEEKLEFVKQMNNPIERKRTFKITSNGSDIYYGIEIREDRENGSKFYSSSSIFVKGSTIMMMMMPHYNENWEKDIAKFVEFIR